MKKFNFVILLCIVLFSTSCNKKVLYSHFEEFDQLKWQKNDKVRFEIPIYEQATNQNVFLSIRHTAHFYLNGVTFKMTKTLPSGNVEQKSIFIPIKDDKNSYMGDGNGDVYDVTVLVDSAITFTEIGEYKFDVEYQADEELIVQVYQVGVIIKSSDAE